MSPTGSLDFGLVVSNLGLGAVVTAPVSPVGIGLEELSSPSGCNPCLLAEPSRKMAAIEGAGCDLGGHSQKTSIGRSRSTWFVGTIQVSATSFAHVSGMTKMFQRTSRNSFR